MRISTKNHGQTTDTQALALQEYAQHRGFEMIGEYRDEGISGSKDSRPALGAVAKLERNLIKERVHMGINRARKEGKQLGRPKRIFDRDRARTMLQTMSAREVARQLGVSRGVIERAAAING